MKIEKLENHKIKVSLTVNDLMLFNIKPETLSSDSPELNRFLFSVMESVKKATGFNPYCGQVIVEAIRNDLGVTLYISRARETAEKTNNRNLKKLKSVSLKKNHSECTYLFEDFDDLCDALKLMSDDVASAACLYMCDNKWYVILSTAVKYEEYHHILSEYSIRFGSGLYNRIYLAEHGKLICEGETMKTFLDGIKGLSEEKVL